MRTGWLRQGSDEAGDPQLVTKLLHIIAFTNVAITVMFSVVAPFVQSSPGPVWIASAVMVAFWFLVIGLARAGHVRNAAILATAGHFLFITGTTAAGGGLDAPGASFYLSTVLIAVLTLGRGPGVAVAVASGVALVVVFVLGQLSWLPEPSFVASQGWRLFVLEVSLAFLAVLVMLTLDQLNSSLQRARESEREAERSLRRLREAQTALVQAGKMEAIGKLAGGVAHDFNNILTAIGGFASMLQESDAIPAEDREMLTEIDRAVQRAAALTRQLLAFSRRQVLQLRIVDMGEVVSGMDQMLARLLGADIELTTGLEAGLWRVEADRNQLERVIMNLVVNAREAMPEGGRIHIETANVQVGETLDGDHGPVATGDYVMLSVRDTGAGMDEATQKHVFEPFFTTRELGQGTGLGLATVYGIVNQLGGTIRLHSQPGRGTNFQIFLPRSTRLPAPETPTPVRGRLREGAGLVLLAEDQADVRDLTRQVLLHAGYQVITAADGHQAIAEYERVGRVDLLVTDVVMPRGLRGPELADLLLRRQPDLKVLFVSGYADNGLDGRVGPGDYLEKPFAPSQLLQEVGRIMEGSPVQ